MSEKNVMLFFKLTQYGSFFHPLAQNVYYFTFSLHLNSIL